MSYIDFNDEGPGTFGWDYVLGQNTTGLFPDETHYLIDGDVLEEITFTYAGGETWRTLIGECLNIDNINPQQDGSVIFEINGVKYRAVVNHKLRMKSRETIYDIFRI